MHAAVIGRVDQCQDGPALAEATNATLPATVARLCRERALRLVALSTDMVFAGDRAPLREDDPARPLSTYGRTKREGEHAVLEALPEAAVARIALVYGRGHGARGTSSESIAWSLPAGRRAVLFTDEHRTPVDAESVADAIARLLRRGGAGIYHLGGPERVSRYELGVRVARVLGLDATLVVASRQDEHRATEPRPRDVSLDSAARAGSSAGSPGRSTRFCATAGGRGSRSSAFVGRRNVSVRRQSVSSSPSSIGVSTPVASFFPLR